jgi:hypothetical protein
MNDIEKNREEITFDFFCSVFTSERVMPKSSHELMERLYRMFIGGQNNERQRIKDNFSKAINKIIEL